jgi:DNA (cytosine-5)-methyltransferase 1
MRVLDLFSGIGGFSVGLHEAGMETVGFCEMDSFCQKVLKKHWPNVPIHSDIKELDGHEYRGTVELVCGGFPCQPFSVAGNRRGAEDDRALWPEMLRVIREVQPTWVIGENVTGIVAMELDTVLSDLEGEGYSCQTFVIPACSVDAQHRRDRVWVVAYADSEGEPDGSQHEQRLVADSSGQPRGSRRVHRESGDEGWETSEARGEGVQPKHWQAQPNHTATCRKDVADTESLRMERRQELRGVDSFGTRSVEQPQRCFDDAKPAVWGAEPRVGRVADGVPNRTHRLKGLGNAVVPTVVTEIGRVIMHFHENGIDPRG